jgi:hypothetical protein
MTGLGKDNTPAPGRPKPTLIKIGDQEVISNGRWNNELVADHIFNHARNDWMPIGKLARVCGGNNIATKRKVRSRLAQICAVFLVRGKFLCVEYNSDHGAASAVKVADLTSDEDRDNVVRRLERQRKRKEMTQLQYERAMALLHATDARIRRT